MQMTPKISVVLCNYNDSRFLIHAIDNIIEQGPDEIIIVDDLSSDCSVDIIRTLYPNIKLIINDKKGVFNAYIKGVKAATCEYICPVACDDEFLSGYMDRMRQAIWDYPFVDFYCCGAHVQREGRTYLRRLFPFDSYVSPQYLQKIFKAGLSHKINMSGIIMKKDVILKCWEGGGKKLKANFDSMCNFYAMFDKGFMTIKDFKYLYRSYPTGFGASGKADDIDEANKIQMNFFKTHLSYESFVHLKNSGVCQKKDLFITQLALLMIRIIPNFARRKFYQWFYGYDERIEKL